MKTVADLEMKVKEVALGLAGGVEVLSEEAFGKLSQSIDDMVSLKSQIEQEKGRNFRKPILSTVSCDNTGHNLLTRILDSENLPARTKELLVKCLDLGLFDPNKSNVKTGEFPIDFVMKKHRGHLGLLEALFNSGAKIGKYINVQVNFLESIIFKEAGKALCLKGTLKIQQRAYLTEVGWDHGDEDLYLFLESDLLKTSLVLNSTESKDFLNKIKDVAIGTSGSLFVSYRACFGVPAYEAEYLKKQNKVFKLAKGSNINLFFDKIDPRFTDPTNPEKPVVQWNLDEMKRLNFIDHRITKPRLRKPKEEGQFSGLRESFVI